MNRPCQILNASQFIRGKRLLQLTRHNDKLPFTRKQLRNIVPEREKKIKERRIELGQELATQPKHGSSLDVYRRYYQKELQKPGRAALEEQYDKKMFYRYLIIAIVMVLYIGYGFLEELDYCTRWLKNKLSAVDEQIVKRHGPVLIDQSQRLIRSPLGLVSIIQSNSFFVETDDTPPKRGDKVLLSRRPLAYIESSFRILFRNKKCVLIVTAAEGDTVLLDGIEVVIPEGYLWVESMRPFNRLTLDKLNMFALTLESNFWDCSAFSRTFSYEMRTSSDFGFCPIECTKKVKSIHRFSYQEKYDIPKELMNLLPDVKAVEGDNSTERKLLENYSNNRFIPDNIQAFNQILNTPGIEYLESMSHVNHNDQFKVIHNRRSSDIPCKVRKTRSDQLPELDITNVSIDEEEFRRDILSVLDNPQESEVPISLEKFLKK